MPLEFNEKTGFSVDTVADVRAKIAAQWKSAFKADNAPELNTEPETPAGQLIDSETAAIAQKDSELLFLANMLDPLKASGIFQDALGAIYFLQRKGAIASSAVIKCTGLAGTVIPLSAQIMSTADNSIWQNTAEMTIGDNGVCECVFECTQAGAISAAANTLTKVNTVVAGWDAATNPAAATVGQAAESQGAFENRRYKSVALNSRGTAAAVYARVGAVDNVVAVLTRENKTNVPVETDGYFLKPHSIYVAVLGGADADIANAIYQSCSAGCDYNGNTLVNVTDENTGAVETVSFYRPAEFDIYVKVTLQNKAALPDSYETIVKDAVYANFYGEDTDTTIAGEPVLRVIMGDTVLSSRFIPSILNAGISQIVSVQLSTDGENWSESVYIPITGAPALSAENITVEVL